MIASFPNDAVTMDSSVNYQNPDDRPIKTIYDGNFFDFTQERTRK